MSKPKHPTPPAKAEEPRGRGRPRVYENTVRTSIVLDASELDELRTFEAWTALREGRRPRTLSRVLLDAVHESPAWKTYRRSLKGKA